jgi:hypothetical protein
MSHDFDSTFNEAEAKVDDNLCKSLCERYKELTETKFREKYKAQSFVNDCIKLQKPYLVFYWEKQN